MLRHAITLTCYLLVAAACACCLEPSGASAQACCVGGGGQLGVVGRERRAALTARLGYQRAMGSYANDGSYHGLRGASIDDLTLELGGGVRLFDHRLELSGTLPTRLQHRSYRGSQGSARVGLGDASLGVGLMLIRGSVDGVRRREPGTWIPFLDLNLGVLVPSGRAPENSHDQNGADVMGGGHFTLQGGLRLSQFVSLRQILTLSVLFERGLARDVHSLAGASHRYRPGAAVSLRASWLYARDMRWSGGLFVTTRLGRPAHQDRERVAGSASRSFSFGALLSWVFILPIWEATLSMSVDPFFSGPGRNLPQVGPRLSLLMKRSF
ncbi:MAG: hypothetical protein GXP55_15925 [Deltaproteobacteria bacterium]|nr:hypothetical protein [Deltaproteobacteria bacterium]